MLGAEDASLEVAISRNADQWRFPYWSVAPEPWAQPPA